jgi:hypothetical protein
MQTFAKMDLLLEYLMALHEIHKLPVTVEAIVASIATCKRIYSCICLVRTRPKLQHGR